MKRKTALSIAGSDSSGGAGIQADLRTFSSLGINGLAVITCVTAQNTKQVKKIHKIPIDVIEQQFDILVEDFKIDAVKTGMLYDPEIVKCIGYKINKNNMKSVVDPIMTSTTGDSLIKKNFVNSIKKNLLPYSYLITPNINEAQILSNIKIKTVEDIKRACKIIFNMGPENVIITGGHFKSNNSIDVFFNGKNFYFFSLPKIPYRTYHGAGCIFSSLITGILSIGKKPIEAIEQSKNIIWNMISYGYKIGKNLYVPNISLNVINDSPYSFPTNEHFITWFELRKIVKKLLPKLSKKFIPEVGINMGYALKEAKEYKDICAIDGRIVNTQSGPKRCGMICFNSSKHIASIILALMSFNSEYRSAMNIKYSKDILLKLKKEGLKIGSFNRKKEPINTSTTMEWGTKEVIIKLNNIPDVIYDTGDLGKEPMIRLLGKNPKDLFDKLNNILEN